MELTRRELIKASAAIAVVGATSRLSRASDGPLPSWNEGSSKKAILDFVHATTDASARTLYRQKSASLPLIRMAHCGLSTRSTRRSCLRSTV